MRSTPRRNRRPPQKYGNEEDEPSPNQQLGENPKSNTPSDKEPITEPLSDEPAATPRRQRRPPRKYSPDGEPKKNDKDGSNKLDSAAKSTKKDRKRVPSTPERRTRKKPSPTRKSKDASASETKDSSKTDSTKEKNHQEPPTVPPRKRLKADESTTISPKQASSNEESKQVEATSMSQTEPNVTKKAVANSTNNTTQPVVQGGSAPAPGSVLPPAQPTTQSHGNTAVTHGASTPEAPGLSVVTTPARPTTQCLDTVCQRLVSNDPYLLTVDLTGQPLSLSNMKTLVAALVPCKVAKKLVLSDCRIGDDGVKLLTTEATKAANGGLLLSCESLWLNGNGIGPAGAALLAAWLSLPKPAAKLKRLFLAFNKMGPSGAKALASSLASTAQQDDGAQQSWWANIEMMDLGENHICSDGAAAFGTMLSSLAKVHQQANNSGPYFCLKELFLYGNSIGNSGASSLAKALKANPPLEELDLRCNDISNAGAVAIGRALRHNQALQTFVMFGNRFDKEGAAALVNIHDKRKVVLYVGEVVPYL